MEFCIQLITTVIDITTKFNSCSLNSIWSSLGIIEISFLRFLQIIFFIIFIFLNFFLIYTEYRDIQSKIQNNSEYLQSGTGTTSNIIPHIKKYTTYFLAGAAALSSYIAIKNEYITNASHEKEIAVYKQNLAAANEELKKVKDKQIVANMYNRMNIDSLDRNFKEVQAFRTNRSKLQKEIAEDYEKYKETGDKSFETKAKLKETEEKVLVRDESRVVQDFETTMHSSVKFSREISKEADEEKILEIIKEDINKSSVFGFDLEKILKELWKEFESFDGITKLAFVMVLTSSLILWCVVSIILNRYSEYLLDRFKIESKYPKIAIFIKYRRKLSTYYL
jgi:hypothetical protein